MFESGLFTILAAVNALNKYYLYTYIHTYIHTDMTSRDSGRPENLKVVVSNQDLAFSNPGRFSHNREAQLHTSPDHLLVVPPLLQICSLFRKSSTNHPSYIHAYTNMIQLFVRQVLQYGPFDQFYDDVNPISQSGGVFSCHVGCEKVTLLIQNWSVFMASVVQVYLI